MAVLELDGDTLGQKHHHYNILLQDAIKNKRTLNIDDFNQDNCDIINLLNIDIACHNKDVMYFLKVLTCEDSLYASRAIKQSNWLINDEKYSDIINPNYLRTSIFPQMCSKTIIKLIKHIRNYLNSEKRAEEFYSSEVNPKEAVKWLPICSLEFIQKNFINHVEHIKITLLRRLCEKEITILEIYIKSENAPDKGKALQTNMFLLSSNTDKYLDLVEAVPHYYVPTFNRKATIFVMKTCSKRIIDKFEIYYNNIHLSTFIKFLKKDNIKEFLLDQALKMDRKIHQYFNLNRLLLFIKWIPQDIRFEFVKQIFIDKIHESKGNTFSEKETRGLDILCSIITENNRNSYDHIWYQFAPFDIAFQKIKELIGTASSAKLKISMFEIILSTTQNKTTQEHKFLEYFRDKHNKIEYHIKEQIMNKLISQKSFLKYDKITWIVLEDIFKSMDIYIVSENQDHNIIEAILLYKVIHEEKVPDAVEKKFNFNSLVPYHKKLSFKEKELLFTYLYNHIMSKFSKCDTKSEEEFAVKIDIIKQVLNLLKDFKVDLQKHSDVIFIIKDLVRIKNDYSWTVNMEELFNIKKEWRKLFFNESLMLCPSELTLLNSLKHGPYLLEQNKGIIQNLLFNEDVISRHFLGKIKIYFSNSLARNIKVTYTEKLNELGGGHKATTLGLCILLPRKNLKELTEKYAPTDAKDDWSKIDELQLSFQHQFAKNMHNARPQPYPETILRYAKGHYLQYALPSLLSIFYNLNVLSSRIYIPTLLDAPVSLQKHGIRLAVSKMETGELLCYFSNIWNNNTNASIRSVMFKNVFNLLCKEKDSQKIHTIWELIKIFMDNLTFQEDKAIYKLLFEVEKIPIEVRGCFYMKSYTFLKQLLNMENQVDNYKDYFSSIFTKYCTEIIEQLSPNFVSEIIIEFIEHKFLKEKVESSYYGTISLISSYLLVSTNEEIQLERYETIVQPLLKRSLNLWDTVIDGERFIRNNLAALLNNLRCDIEIYVVEKKKVIPRAMFSLILKELEKNLSTPENYMMLTKWKLTNLFISILDRYQPIFNWKEACIKISKEFGNLCSDYLREDCEKYFNRIYLLFTKALQSMLNNFVPQIAQWDVYRCLIGDKNFIQGYLAAIKLFPQSTFAEDYDENKRKSKELMKIISENNSIEIKMHLYNYLKYLL